MKEDTRVPALRQGNYLFLETGLGGQRLLLCVDSGAGIHVLSPEAGARLGLLREERGSQTVTGTAASVRAQKVLLRNLRLGAAALADTEAVVVALPGLLGCDGLLGYPLFAQFAVTLDYLTSTVTLTPYAEFTPPDGATALALRLEGNIPQLEVRLDGLPAWVELDTGSSGELDLTTPFVEANRLRERYPKRIAMPTGLGVGGVTYGDVARAERLELGPFALPKPLIRLSQQTTGADASQRVAGRLGAEVLSRFRLTFDYQSKRLFLTPNTRLGDPFLFTRTGLLPVREGKNWVVFHVLPDSPASEAGIQAGDRLLFVNARATERLSAYTLNELFRQPVGTKLELNLRSAEGRARRVPLVLRELL